MKKYMKKHKNILFLNEKEVNFIKNGKIVKSIPNIYSKEKIQSLIEKWVRFGVIVTEYPKGYFNSTKKIFYKLKIKVFDNLEISENNNNNNTPIISPSVFMSPNCSNILGISKNPPLPLMVYGLFKIKSEDKIDDNYFILNLLIMKKRSFFSTQEKNLIIYLCVKLRDTKFIRSNPQNFLDLYKKFLNVAQKSIIFCKMFERTFYQLFEEFSIDDIRIFLKICIKKRLLYFFIFNEYYYYGHSHIYIKDFYSDLYIKKFRLLKFDKEFFKKNIDFFTDYDKCYYLNFLKFFNVYKKKKFNSKKKRRRRSKKEKF